MIKKMHMTLKDSSRSLSLVIAKILSGALIGLTLALILRGFLTLSHFSFTFVIVAMTGAFMKLSQKWKMTGVILFNLFCVMTALLLRMYILIAPGD
jgi:hypothetical protein